MHSKIIALIVVVVVVAGGLYYFMSGKQESPEPISNTPMTNQPAATPSSAPSVTPTKTSNVAPSPTPTPSLVAQTLGTGGTVFWNNANLRGRVTTNGLVTSYWFEYGTTTSLGSKTTISSVPSTTKAIDVVKNIKTEASTRYYFRLVTESSAGTSKGEILSFSTPAK